MNRGSRRRRVARRTGGVELDEVEMPEEMEVEEKELQGAELGVENGELEITENGKDGRGVIEGGELGISGVDVSKERLGKGADVLFDDTWDEPLRLSTRFTLSFRANVNMTPKLIIVDRKQVCIFCIL
jgi:hypothetical protein